MRPTIYMPDRLWILVLGFGGCILLNLRCGGGRAPSRKHHAVATLSQPKLKYESADISMPIRQVNQGADMTRSDRRNVIPKSTAAAMLDDMLLQHVAPCPLWLASSHGTSRHIFSMFLRFGFTSGFDMLPKVIGTVLI